MKQGWITTLDKIIKTSTLLDRQWGESYKATST
jgi:hypothetical protein